MRTFALSDEHVVGVLAVVVRGSGPFLDALTQTDPFGLKSRTHTPAPFAPAQRRAPAVNLKNRAVRGFYAAEFPGTAAWARMNPQQRTLWWINRVGRFTTLVVSVPGFAGVIADRLPLQATLGAASQAMVLCAVAREWGVADQTDQVRLLAWVLCRRAVSAELVRGAPERTDSQLKADGVDAGGERSPRAGRRTPAGAAKTAAKTLWRHGRVLRSIVGELDKRPQGRWAHRMLGKAPVVGMVADYLGERSALKRAVRQADQWVRANARSLG